MVRQGEACVRAALVLVLVGGALSWGCLGPRIADGAIACDDTSLCPEGYECAVNGRCYRYAGQCGDSVVDPGETCDPTAFCPTSCNDGNACSKDELLGSEETCNLRCSHSSIDACRNDDGCCPDGCDSDSDSDCSATCGNDTIDPLETCDGADCDAITCNDGDACTTDERVGTPSHCNVRCVFVTIDSCVSGDGCCPAACNSKTDGDCSPTCGDGTVNAGETCDPPDTCPTLADCDDNSACTVDELVGSAANCNASCKHTVISACESGDGCCPVGCTVDTDDDCVVATCGNGQLDSGETCDDSSPDDPCPDAMDCAELSKADMCTIYTLVGNIAACTAECTSTPITECGPADGCCPDGCYGTVYVGNVWLPPSIPGYDPDCGASP